MRIVIEQSAPEAEALARLLVAEGHDVRVTDCDTDRAPADIAYLDVWTPETAERVARLRAAGTRITCASELVLERVAQVGARTLGLTGTAGKSTTATLAVQVLRAAGRPVLATANGRLGHLWVTDELVERAPAFTRSDIVVLELTSSHLAFMSSSPDVAVVTSFWPDHLELHGSVEAYRAAKEVIVRHQHATGAVVVNAEDVEAVRFAELTPARRFAFAVEREVVDGAFARNGFVFARLDGEEAAVGRLPASPTLARAAVAATAAALAVGVPPSELQGTLDSLEPPPHRQQSLGFVGGALVVDDGMASTPAKARAAIAGLGSRSVVLIAGGRLETDGGAVHASDSEGTLLEGFYTAAAKAVRVAVLFGAAAARLEPELAKRGVSTRIVPSLDEAVAGGLREARVGDMVVFSPVFPVSPEDRERFAALVRAVAASALN